MNGQVFIEDQTNGILAVSGSTQIDPFTARIDSPNALMFNGTTGDDNLLIDFTNGNPIPAGGLVFNGGTGFDSLEIEGLDEEFDAYTVNFMNPTDGNFQFRTGVAVDATLTFLGIDPLTIDGTSSDVIFNLPSTNDTNVFLSAVDEDTMILTGTTFEDTTFSIAAATSITINGNRGNDKITISSVASNYTGSLIVDGGKGNDTLDASNGDFAVTLLGGNGKDSLTGGDLGDSLDGGAGNDQIFGRDGDDTLTGGAGNDLLDGQDGTADCVTEVTTGNFELGNTRLTGNGTDTLANIECAELFGNASKNTLDASKFTRGPVTLHGGNGNDLLIGSSSSDSLNGGDGTDTVKQSSTGDQTITNSEITSPSFGTDVLESIEGAHLIVSGRTGATLDATDADFPVTLMGGAGNDILMGGSQADSLEGGAGDDLAIGNDGNDRIRGGAGHDRLEGNDDDDQLFGDAGNDLIFGGDDQDLINGGAGNDILLGEQGRDSLFGGDGNDALSGGTGNDSLTGDKGNNTLLGGTGNDVLRTNTSGGREVALGEEDDDIIYSGAFDTISGGSGTDKFFGRHAKIDEAFTFDFGKLLG